MKISIFLILFLFSFQGEVEADCRPMFKKGYLAYKTLAKLSKKRPKKANFYQLKSESLREVYDFLNSLYLGKKKPEFETYSRKRGFKYNEMAEYFKILNSKKIFCQDESELPSLIEIYILSDRIAMRNKAKK